jgi:hypothetical protein
MGIDLFDGPPGHPHLDGLLLAGYLQILVDREEQGELEDAEEGTVGNLRILKVVLLDFVLELLED